MPLLCFPNRTPALVLALALLAGCQTGTPYRDPTARAEPDMHAVLLQYEQAGGQPMHTLTVAQARAQSTMAAAFHTVMAGKAMPAAPFVQVTPRQVDGAAGSLPTTLFNPMPGRRDLPIILYFHGGLYATGSADEDADVARALAVGGKAMVLSVNYRLAPEAKFPAAYDDAISAYRWLLGHAVELGADPRRIAVGGQGAGGTLAVDIAVAARDGGFTRPVQVVLIDPLGGTADPTDSAVRNTYGVPLDRADVTWSLAQEARTPADLADPRLDPLGSADMHNLPPVTIVTSELNPIGSDARVLGSKMEAAGVDIRQIQYAGTTNEFFGMGAGVGRAKEAETFAAVQLTGTFDKIGAPKVQRAGAGERHHPARRRVVRHKA